MENGKDQKINCDMKTDLNLLLECLKYQMDHPASQKEALVTIYSVCQQNVAACEYFREIGGLIFVWNLAKSQVHSLVQEAALFTIGGLAENNVFCQQMLCTAELFKDLHTFLTNKDSSMNLKRMSVYVLLVLASNNNSGQTHVRESGCLDILLHLFRVIPSESQINLFDGKIDQYHLWSSVCSNLCVCVNNPQNEENQKACSLVFPYAKYWLQSSMKAEIIRPICSFIGLTVANNSRTQNFFISIGGLAVLDELLLKLIHGSLGNNTNIKLAVVVTKTLDACIANNTAVGVHLPKYNIVPNLLKLLSYNILDSGERFSIMLTLGHCTEVCEENQYTLIKNNGLPLMIQALTEMQDDELNKAATFVLQNCKQMTEKLSVKMNQHSFQEDERRILEVDWQNEERILEDYWNEAKQILYRIKGLENEQEENIRREILIDEDAPQEKFLQAMTQHHQTNSSKQPSDNSKIYLEMKHPLQNTISKVQTTSKFEKSSSRCRIGRLSLNSRNFSKTLQSCQYLCEQHKIILESEMEYKRKLRRSIMANKNISAYNNASFQCDARSKNQTMKQIYSLQDQDLSENHPFEEENTETLSNSSTTTLKKRRIRKDFTSEEISYLLEGVRKMGHHWNSILWAYPFQEGRTNVDLAKKYGRLQKNGKSRNTQPL
ncbi:telomere repeats-binding bouquet formation protein 1 [Notechis scutatus]|uniref:Telomere repeats-binding bouquet formation protein 1 n=1 Tax=Notechis scutatus TaxID=8663 RepID=A0A6J1UBQ6_9SAUR|nr:telomere repeats-binding bouquet formation protein 1 [Notechis scutatus]